MATMSPGMRSASLPVRIAAAWLLIFLALGLAGWTGERVEAFLGAGSRGRYWLQAFIMSGLVVPGIWWLRTRVDCQSMKGLGFPGWRRSLTTFGLGIGIIALPVLAIVVLTTLAGWGTVILDLSPTGLARLWYALGTVFLFEALPEELVFRGYIYRNLNTALPRWAAGALTVVLFVLLPVLLTPVQHYLIGTRISVGGAGSITASYIITMMLFGVFTQYLRILSGTIWTSIGFHFAFVLANRIVGPRPSAVIRFVEITSPAPVQVLALASALIVIIALVSYPRLAKRRLGWGERAPA